MKTIRCEDCEHKVLLDGSFTCTCGNCGADYNTFGQRLALTVNTTLRNFPILSNAMVYGIQELKNLLQLSAVREADYQMSLEDVELEEKRVLKSVK